MALMHPVGERSPQCQREKRYVLGRADLDHRRRTHRRQARRRSQDAPDLRRRWATPADG